MKNHSKYLADKMYEYDWKINVVANCEVVEHVVSQAK